MGVKITGLSGLVNNLRELGADIDGIVDGSLNNSAKMVERDILSNINSVSASYNGHTYKAYDVGTLYASVEKTKISNGYAVGPKNCDHCAEVEFGTGSAGDPSVPHTSRPKWTYFNDKVGAFRTAYPAPPRPYMRPAFEKDRDPVLKNLKDDIWNAYRQARKGR